MGRELLPWPLPSRSVPEMEFPISSTQAGRKALPTPRPISSHRAELWEGLAAFFSTTCLASAWHLPDFFLVRAGTPRCTARCDIALVSACVRVCVCICTCACGPFEGVALHLAFEGRCCVSWGGGPSVWCYPCLLCSRNSMGCFPYPHHSLPSSSAALHTQACG